MCCLILEESLRDSLVVYIVVTSDKYNPYPTIKNPYPAIKTLTRPLKPLSDKQIIK